MSNLPEPPVGAPTETIADISAAILTGRRQPKYPTELDFRRPLWITAVLVLGPALALWHFGPPQWSQITAYRILFGNWVSPFILWFAAASALYLWVKRGALAQEMLSTHLLASQVLPAVLAGSGTDLTDLTLFRRLRDGLFDLDPRANPWNLLLSRCRLLLARSAPAADAAADPGGDDADLLDRDGLRTSFALPRYLIWAVPILGFVGTVWGISQGIDAFSDAMAGAGSADVSVALKDNLPLVTSNLATAFDTTFLALILSIPLMLLLTWAEKAEENYLITLDELWAHELRPQLRRRARVPVCVPVEDPAPAVAPTADLTGLSAQVQLLTAQVSALQATMHDLYETLFESSLTRGSKSD